MTTILKKGEDVLLTIYKGIRDKFTKIPKLLKKRFPILEQKPVLFYSIIPVIIALFFGLRYILKLGFNELADWTSTFVGETSGFAVSEKTIVGILVGLLILIKIVLTLRNKKTNKTEAPE